MSELRLDDVEWRSFWLTDVVDIKPGKDIYKEERVEGLTPYITATAFDNGVGYFVGNNNSTKEEDGISVNSNGSIGYAFYHPYSALYGNDTRKLIPKIKNKYTSLFITRIIINQKDKYNYGYKMGTERLKKQKVMLPVDSEDQPNWQFMEGYIKQEEKKQVQELIDYYEDKLIWCKAKLLKLDKEVEWQVFEFNEIFQKIQRGKRLTKANQIKGNDPYVSSTVMNNGVDNFIANKDNVRIFNNCLTVANSGSVGSCFFHYYKFVASDHVTTLEVEGGDKYVYLFMSSIIKRLEEKYSFNREINNKRIKKEKIILPVDENGNPNYEYMRVFMQQLESEKIFKIINYYKN